MNKERWESLMELGGPLTKEEKEQGWHFCPSLDYAVVGPDHMSWDFCECYHIKDRVNDRKERNKSEG